MQGNRPETNEINLKQIKQDAQALADADTEKFKTDEAKFNALYCDRSDSQLRAIFNEFNKLTGKSIGMNIKNIFNSFLLYLIRESS